MDFDDEQKAITRRLLQSRGTDRVSRVCRIAARFLPVSFPSSVVVALLLLQSLIIVWSPLRTSPNIAYFLESGRRILAGDLPYVDFFSENLLTIKYLNVLPVAISEWTNVNSLSVWLILSLIGTATSVACTYQLSVRVFARYESPYLRWLIPLCVAAIAWLSLFTTEFGEREHLFVLGAMPWLLYRLCKLQSMRFRSLPSFTIGFVAGLVASIKPHFMLVIMAVELCWILQAPRSLKFVDMGLVGFALVPLANLAYFLVNPDALDGLLRWIVPYLASGRPDLLSGVNTVYVLRIVLPCIIAMLAFGSAFRRDRAGSRMLAGFAIFAGASAGIVFMQSLREFYRLIPLYVGVMACGGMLILFQTLQSGPHRNRKRLIGDLLYGTMLLIAAIGTTSNIQNLTNVTVATPKDLQKILLDSTEPGDDVLFLTRWLGIKFPWLRIVNRNEANSMLGIWKPLLEHDGEVTVRGLQLQLDIVRMDIEASPAAIVVDSGAGIRKTLETSGLLELIESRYRRVGEIQTYTVYVFFGRPPLQGTSFTLGDKFELYSWRVPPKDVVLQVCDPLELTTWWRPLVGEGTERFTLHVDLVEPGGGAVVEQFGRIGNEEDYMAVSSIIDQRQLSLPCELKAGFYWLLLSLEDMSVEGGDVLPVRDSNGGDYGKYVYMGEFEIRS